MQWNDFQVELRIWIRNLEQQNNILLIYGSCLTSFRSSNPTEVQALSLDLGKLFLGLTLHKKATIHQETTMLATSRNVLFPGYNHLLTTGADDLTLWLLPERQWAIRPRFNSFNARWRLGNNQSVGSSALLVSRWLWPGTRTFLEQASMVVSWWIVAFLPGVCSIFLCHILSYQSWVNCLWTWNREI